MIDNKKCMGDVWNADKDENGKPIGYRYKALCLECTRLPRKPEDEDEGPWYNPVKQAGKYCTMQRKEK
jgi:hypothetical protein